MSTTKRYPSHKYYLSLYSSNLCTVSRGCSRASKGRQVCKAKLFVGPGRFRAFGYSGIYDGRRRRPPGGEPAQQLYVVHALVERQTLRWHRAGRALLEGGGVPRSMQPYARRRGRSPRISGPRSGHTPLGDEMVLMAPGKECSSHR